MVEEPITRQGRGIANKATKRSVGIIKIMQKKKKGKSRNEKQIGKQKTNSNMVDLNPDISIITLNIGNLNTAIKSRDYQIGLKKARTNFVLSIRTHFKTLDTNLFLI